MVRLIGLTILFFAVNFLGAMVAARWFCGEAEAKAADGRAPYRLWSKEWKHR